MTQMIKGVDLSTLYEVENLGGKFYNNGKEEDIFTILKSYGINAVRLRLWNDPYSEDGMPYGAGTNDLNRTILMAKRALSHGMEFLLCLHYSDFWADPGKQFLPKAWRKLDEKQLKQAVFDYTAQVMNSLKEENALPTMVAVGNELSNGLLWPTGKMPHYDTIADYVNAGIKAVRTVDKSLPIMIHLDNGGNNALYRDWFDHFLERGEDFQVIGLSYYPFWHGSLQSLEDNMNDIAVRYGKDLIVAEVSMGFSSDSYYEYEKSGQEEKKGMATKPALAEKIEYPMTPKGQADFMQDFLQRLDRIKNNKAKGFYYWEPAWIPVKGSGWANEASLKYINDPGPGGNEWANQALFDYDGNALPALRVIKDF